MVLRTLRYSSPARLKKPMSALMSFSGLMLATHQRHTSAPWVFIRSSTLMVLPSLLLILWPFLSTMKPWVSTVLNGDLPCSATDGSSECWNQPRCWSEPSRYRSAGNCAFCACLERQPSRSTLFHDEPD